LKFNLLFILSSSEYYKKYSNCVLFVGREGKMGCGDGRGREGGIYI
jgi:hypothetical protein